MARSSWERWIRRSSCWAGAWPGEVSWSLPSAPMHWVGPATLRSGRSRGSGYGCRLGDLRAPIRHHRRRGRIAGGVCHTIGRHSWLAAKGGSQARHTGSGRRGLALAPRNRQSLGLAAPFRADVRVTHALFELRHQRVGSDIVTLQLPVGASWRPVQVPAPEVHSIELVPSESSQLSMTSSRGVPGVEVDRAELQEVGSRWPLRSWPARRLPFRR